MLRVGLQYSVRVIWSRRWCLHRRMFYQAFRQDKTPTYHALQLRSAHKMLFSLLQDPGSYPSYVQIASFILSAFYGYKVTPNDDTISHYGKIFPFHMFTNPVIACDYIPTVILVLRLPSWFPGATFKQASVKCLNAGHEVKEIPFQPVKEKMSPDGEAQCFVTETFNKMELSDDDDIVITTAVKEPAAIAFQKHKPKRTRIDRVVGKDQFPGFDDRPALPYAKAILRETLRWHPAFPLALRAHNDW
ncbi:cytochrome P450 [Suillus spraguei]|nr:cytochrome P450 [Suillus spraguei]